MREFFAIDIVEQHRPQLAASQQTIDRHELCSAGDHHETYWRHSTFSWTERRPRARQHCGDHVIAADTSAAYFQVLTAPAKQLVWFEESAREPPFEEPAKFNRAMVELLRPCVVGSAL